MRFEAQSCCREAVLTVAPISLSESGHSLPEGGQ
jgi:hypothetical protein